MMFDFLEVEEFVGKKWHALVGRQASYPRHPAHGVDLTEVQGLLAVFFRGLGGEAGVQVAGGMQRTSGHRLGWKQRLGLGEERMDQPRRDESTLFLPPRIELFAETGLNRDLYLWLAAYFAFCPFERQPDDPLQAGIAAMRQARRTTAAVLGFYPGLQPLHRRLVEALRAIRPRRALPGIEAEVEACVLALLGGPPAEGAVWQAVTGESDLSAFKAPLKYRGFLPVPLWGEVAGGAARAERCESEEMGGGAADARDGKTRKATRQKTEEAQRNDPLCLNRFEKIMAFAEMIDLNRAVDDDDEESAKKAADDLDEIAVGKHQSKPSTKLKFDLDLPPEAVDPTAIIAELTYPEWDYRARSYHPGHCRVVAGMAGEEGESWQPDAETHKRIRQVRRQFEALRPKAEILHRQVDGTELDLDAVVRAQSDLRASGCGSDAVYLDSRKQARDLSVALLMDVSLSTDSWIENRRVLDVEKEALTVLAHGLAACGDDHAIYTFTSRKRSWVRVDQVKDFDEPLSPAVTRRIAALKPGFYTRIGAAVRHVTAQLAERPNRNRLLILVTDGKPNDLDHYEGRYGVEDTRKAIQEARRAGISLFGVTIDKDAKDYFPVLFGRGGYSIVSHISRLPSALPSIYRQIVSA